MEDIKFCIVNDAGTKAIKAFLKHNHKHYTRMSGAEFDKYMFAWVEVAQATCDNTGVCSIELQDHESNNGRTIVFDLPDDCYDLRSIDENGDII